MIIIPILLEKVFQKSLLVTKTVILNGAQRSEESLYGSRIEILRLRLRMTVHVFNRTIFYYITGPNSSDKWAFYAAIFIISFSFAAPWLAVFL